jgi:hypothetical protein
MRYTNCECNKSKGLVNMQLEKKIEWGAWLILFFPTIGGASAITLVDSTGISGSLIVLLGIFVSSRFKFGHKMNAKCYQLLTRKKNHQRSTK